MNDILRTAEILMNGEPHELRTIGGGRVLSGVYQEAAGLAAAAAALDGTTNVYIGLNPTKLEPYELRAGGAVRDEDITRIRWFAVDIDGETAFDDVIEMSAFLQEELGWPEPIWGSSGHGEWLLWRIEQANNPENTSARREVLAALKSMWPSVDLSVHNPSRIVRLFGTKNMKDGTPADSALILVPEKFRVLMGEKMRALIAHVKEQQTKLNAELLLEKLAEQFGITPTMSRSLVRGTTPAGTVYQLSDCPFVPGETHTEAAAIYQWDDDGVWFKCLGGRCEEERHGLNDLLALLDLEQKVEAVPNPNGGKPRLNWAWAVDIKTEALEFTWDKRLVLGDLNLIVGSEKSGKGLLGSALIMRLSRGLLTGEPVRVAVASTEERQSQVIVPRLKVTRTGDVIGADMSRVAVVEAMIGLPEAIPGLERDLKELGVTWLFLDPVNGHFSQGYNTSDPKDTRYVLQELGAMGRRLGITVVGYLHTNRSAGTDPRARFAHSLEFRRVARSSVMIGRLKDSEEHERIIVHDTPNYAAPSGSINAFIHGVDMETDDGKTSNIGWLELDGDSDASIEDIFTKDSMDPAARAREIEQARSKTDEVVELIMKAREKLGNPKVMEPMTALLQDRGYNRDTLVRAKRKLGYETIALEGSFPSKWVWRFPENEEEA